MTAKGVVILSAAKDLVLGGDTHPPQLLNTVIPSLRSRAGSERSEGSRPHRLWSCSSPFFTQVSPVGIDGLDQGNLLCAHPALYLLLSCDSSVHIGRFFKVD